MIGGTTYVSSCYEKHLNNFSSGLLVCFCVLCCYSTKDRLCRGVYRQSERGRTLHTGKYLIATFQNICQRQCQHSSSRDDYGKLPWKYLTQGRTRARQTICEGFHSANAYGVPTTNMPCSEVSEAANGISTSPAKRLKAETDPKPATAVLKFAKLSENATVPTRGSAKAAGYDLYSAYDYSIAPLDKTIVKTDIQIAVPPGCYGRVAPRSGLAAKHFIDVGAGVVDEDYRGNVGVVLFNFSKETFEVKKGDRVAQLICEKICYPELEQHDTLDVTARGAGGFGSTGTN